MKLTRASSYALHALAYMAQQKTDNPIASHKIAHERGIPERFLLKVLKPLVRARVLESVKGPNGGYRLAKPLSDVTVLEVIEAVDDGEILGEAPRPTRNKKYPHYNPEISMPVYHKLEHMCKQISDTIRKHLEKVKVSELMRR
jgi:Rrf2 family protein